MSILDDQENKKGVSLLRLLLPAGSFLWGIKCLGGQAIEPLPEDPTFLMDGGSSSTIRLKAR